MKEDKGLISDGYHTFNELYEHRHMLFRALCKNAVSWKSKLHSDGTMFEGWFIAGLRTPIEEHDITYHIPMRLWDLFNIKEVERAPIFDGHTSQDVIERLKDF